VAAGKTTRGKVQLVFSRLAFHSGFAYLTCEILLACRTFFKIHSASFTGYGDKAVSPYRRTS
jgi:hypothetical protein